MKELADGTLRVQVDIDPQFRAQFFQWFGQIDMPIALAPLVADFEKTAPEPEEKPKGGALAKLAGIWCLEREFWEFCDVVSAEHAAAHVRYLCRVDSRAQLDHDSEAKRNFEQYVRGPYMKWRAARGLS